MGPNEIGSAGGQWVHDMAESRAVLQSCGISPNFLCRSQRQSPELNSEATYLRAASEQFKSVRKFDSPGTADFENRKIVASISRWPVPPAGGILRFGTELHFTPLVEPQCAEVTQAPLVENHYDVWHDRAVFHFLAKQSERLAYAARASSAIKSGGHLILSPFGPEGPERCSGLNTMRYDAESLQRELGTGFQLIESSIDWHRTPSGAMQQFLHCHFRLER